MNRWIGLVVALTTAGIAGAAGVFLAGLFDLGPVDDAFISLRYATHWASGNGLCFNVDEKVEGYTNFLLVLLEAVAIRSGADPVKAMIVIGWVAFAGLAGLFALFAARHLFPGDVVFPTTAGLLVVLNPVVLCWSASGLEASLYALLVLAAVVLLYGSEESYRVYGSAVCLVLAAWTRPEAVVLLPVMLAVLLVERTSARRVVLYALVFLLIYGAYFTGRALYFGYVFPNTFYAKLDYGNAGLLARGLGYLWSFATAVPVFLGFVILSLCLMPRSPRWVTGFLLVVGVQAAVVAYEGGDHFAMYRFLVPVVPFLAALVLHPFAMLARRMRQRATVAAFVAAGGMVVLAATDLTVGRQAFAGGGSNPTISQFERFRFECRLAEQWRDMGQFLGADAPPKSSLATFAIGAIGFYSRMTIVDMVGIVDPVIAHQERRDRSAATGHDKFDNDYVLSREPSYVLLVAVLTPRPLPEDIQRRMLEAERVQKVNLDMFNNPAFQEEYRPATVRLEGGYMNFFVRRDLPTPEPLPRDG
ncbi:MAG: hypothetical protein JSU68_10780 [Phycisphaerales bacterium]|nr:MAG: hypothetical protein JSU68_10780 [Phycisphaerales bacterium]